jgi:tetratricopeptide (TPR) repeat protein
MSVAPDSTAPATAGPNPESGPESRWRHQLAAAEALLADGLDAEAEAAYRALIKLDDKRLEGYVGVSQCARARGDAAKSLAIFDQAALVYPAHAGVQVERAADLAALGRLAEALRCIMALDPEFSAAPEILARRLNLLRETGDLHEALRLGREMNARLPGHFWIWLERCNAELMLGADADVEACLAVAPAGTAAEAATVRRLAGCLAARRWQLDDAAAHYEAAAALNPADKLTHHDLTRTRILLFDLDGATASLRRFCELSTQPAVPTPNIAQTHYGQIIHEFSFDRETLAELAALLFLLPAERWAALCGAVRDEPGSTAAAIGLMVALRQAGAFAAVAPGARAEVPKQIFHFWTAGSIPDEVAAAMQSWRDHNPDYSFAVYNDTTAQEFMAARFPPAVLMAYRRAREPAQKADIFRLAYLAAAGGIYADVHDRCIGALSAILPHHAELVVYQEEMATLGSNFIAAAPAQPVVLTALQSAVNAINRGDRDIGWLATGPALLTRALAQVLAAQNTATIPPAVLVLERHELFTAVAVHCAANYLRAP